MILEYAPKGELYALLKQVGKFDDPQAATVIICFILIRFYLSLICIKNYSISIN